MTFLRYFLPLIIEGNKRGLSSTVIMLPSRKYNCPYISQHTDQLKLLSEKYNFTLCNYGEENKNKEVVFLVEGVSKEKVSNKSKTISLCFSTDFTLGYERYINDVDHVVIVSKYVSEYYKKHSEKNLYLGSPKFDCVLDDDEILKKYTLDLIRKKAIIFYPRTRDLGLCQLERISSYLKELDYQIIIKSRGKDPIQQNHKHLAEKCLYDFSWFPHTSLELIKVSDLIINFSSSVIEETTSYKKPMINFHIKPFTKPFEFLYDYSFVKNINQDFQKKDFENAVINLQNNNYSTEFKLANDLLFDTKNSSKDIIDFVVNI